MYLHSYERLNLALDIIVPVLALLSRYHCLLSSALSSIYLNRVKSSS